VRLLPYLFLCLLSLDAFAQKAGTDARLARERFFVEASTAAVLYQGDRPWRGASGLSGLSDRMGPGSGFTLGYRWTPSSDVAVSWAKGTYPGILTAAPGLEAIDIATSSSNRTTVLMEYRYRMLPFGRFEPVIGAGWGSVYSRINDLDQWGGGPALSLGVFRPVGPVDLGIQLRQQYVIPDQAIDRAVSGAGADALQSIHFGLRYALPERRPDMGDIGLSTPGFLSTDEEGVFTVSSELDPSDYSVRWELGDGRSATGQAIRHSFREPGTYTVTARISTTRESFALESSVSVRQRIVAAGINTIDHTPLSGIPGDTIRFAANLSGTDVECLWAFGDGASATSCDAEHVFRTPGSYRVLLSVSNAEGSDTMTRTLRIASDACAGIDRLAEVHFRRNSQELVLDMREVLRENFASAARCPDRTLVVSGFAFETERDAQELSLARARAVLQYYLNLGMSSRSVRLGRAVVQSEEGWVAEMWEGRKVSTALIRE